VPKKATEIAPNNDLRYLIERLFDGIGAVTFLVAGVAEEAMRPSSRPEVSTSSRRPSALMSRSSDHATMRVPRWHRHDPPPNVTLPRRCGRMCERRCAGCHAGEIGGVREDARAATLHADAPHETSHSDADSIVADVLAKGTPAPNVPDDLNKL
jgi:hypothetical protein